MLRAMNGASSSLFDPIELMAVDAARNIRRRYSIIVSRDLFGLIVVETQWGRIGARGQSKRLAFTDHTEAERHVAATLRRRGTAKTRIGVAYEKIQSTTSQY
jgi:predicted DNA-binding WGR domain protein